MRSIFSVAQRVFFLEYKMLNSTLALQCTLEMPCAVWKGVAGVYTACSCAHYTQCPLVLLHAAKSEYASQRSEATPCLLFGGLCSFRLTRTSVS